MASSIQLLSDVKAIRERILRVAYDAYMESSTGWLGLHSKYHASDDSIRIVEIGEHVIQAEVFVREIKYLQDREFIKAKLSADASLTYWQLATRGRDYVEQAGILTVFSQEKGHSMSDRWELLKQCAYIGILTALPKEFAAMQVMLTDPVKWSAPGTGAGRRFVLGEIPTENGTSHAVVIAMLPDMGNNSAALSAQNLLHHFPEVRHLIMCGIAGGVPNVEESEHDVRLGDIVISNRNGVVQYDLVKEKPDGSREHRHPPRPPGAELLEAVKHLEAEQLLGNNPWERYLVNTDKVKKAARPADNLGANNEEIDYPHDSERESRLPRIFTGTIAAANVLLKNSILRDYLGKHFGVKAVEMEGSGIADAAWERERGYLVVRGICDYCDERKGDLWQGYAAIAAAAYVRALIESMAVGADVNPP
jgi:nucleoside phosphorylase